jgi:hypothetical protein
MKSLSNLIIIKLSILVAVFSLTSMATANSDAATIVWNHYTKQHPVNYFSDSPFSVSQKKQSFDLFDDAFGSDFAKAHRGTTLICTGIFQGEEIGVYRIVSNKQNNWHETSDSKGLKYSDDFSNNSDALTFQCHTDKDSKTQLVWVCTYGSCQKKK